MSRFQEMYQRKLTTPQAIAAQIQSGDLCAGTSALGEPEAILEAMTDRALAGELTAVQHHMLLPSRRWRYLEPELAGKITFVSWFTSASARKAVKEGRADFMPNYYYEVPRFWREFVKPNVFYAMVSPMDSHGYFSFGLAASEGRAQMSRADKIFLEVNPSMPRVFGDNFVHISEIDAVCESDKPLPTLPDAPLGEKDLKIGDYVAERICDGAAIQLGIGSIPNAVGKKLAGKKDLGIHSEMFTDSMVDLIECGAVTNRRKQIDIGKSVASFAVGSKRMYDYLDDNPGVSFAPVSYVNDPRVISQNDKMISINACLQVDLVGQVCSESVGPANISGTGGQLDFVRGANWSQGGHTFICTYATAKNDAMSSIVPTLLPGAHVSTPKGDVDCIVTEYGIASLKGKTASQRAKALIEISHPKFREALTAAAKKMNLMI